MPESLIEHLAEGPLPLAAGIRYASQIATELCALHRQNRTYGNLTVNSIIISESGAHLQPINGPCDGASVERDIQALGAIFYEILTGTPPAEDLTATGMDADSSGPGSSRVRSAAFKLALKCLAPAGKTLSSRQLAMEIRLLKVLLRQHESFPSPQAKEVNDTQTPALPEMSGGTCPRCGGKAALITQARSRFERLLERWTVPIRSCPECHFRYVVYARLKVSGILSSLTGAGTRP